MVLYSLSVVRSRNRVITGPQCVKGQLCERKQTKFGTCQLNGSHIKIPLQKDQRLCYTSVGAVRTRQQLNEVVSPSLAAQSSFSYTTQFVWMAVHYVAMLFSCVCSVEGGGR